MPTTLVAPKRRDPTRGGTTLHEHHKEFESVALVGGFSVAGLSLACVVLKLPIDGAFAAVTLLLALFAAPIAALLGAALGRSQ